MIVPSKEASYNVVYSSLVPSGNNSFFSYPLFGLLQSSGRFIGNEFRFPKSYSTSNTITEKENSLPLSVSLSDRLSLEFRE